MNLAAKRAVVKTMFRKVSLVIFASSASSGVNQDERALNGAGQVKKKKPSLKGVSILGLEWS